MPPLRLRPAGIALANVAMWAAAHVGAGYVAHRLPLARLEHDGRLLRLRPWEHGGRVYQRLLRTGRRKDRLPEAGAFFAGGLSKRTLPARGEGGVERFAQETRRAELAHWLSLLALPLFPVWNPPVGVLAMVLYGVGFNLPFIVVQRYNRGRTQRVLDARARAVERSSTSRRGRRPEAVDRMMGSSIP